LASHRELVRDRIHQALKRAQRRYLIADYEDLRLRERWLRPVPDAPWEQRTFRVAPDLASVETLLVFKADEIGDAVYALPAIAELRRHAPRARFFLVCQPATEQLYQRAGLFDEITTLEPGSRYLPTRRRLQAALRRLSVDKFDLAVFPKTNPATFREFLRVPARARLHPLDPRMRSSSVYRAHVSMWTDRRGHQALQLLEIVSLATGRSYSFEDVRFPPFAWTDEDRAAPEIALGSEGAAGPYAVVHPFAREETRRYPEEYWPHLLERLGRELDLTWVAVGGPEDEALPDLPGLVQAQGRLTLTQTAYLISQARAFVGNLSGPAHLAGALGVPTVTLMSGASLPAEWAPLGDSLVLRADVPCAPCYRATCPVYRLACLTELTPERVAPEIVEFLGGRLGAPRREAASELPSRSS
jgi:ADP-heptose:LPS heptosyltransferase